MMENVKNAPVKDFKSLNIPPLEEMMESMELGDCGAKLASQGRFDEAIEFFDKALSIIPHSWTVLKMKGFALLSSHRFSKALKVAEELTSVHPIVAEGWMIKGIALCELGKIMKGIPFIEKSLAMNPGLAVAREALAHFRRIMSGNVFG